MTTSPAIPRPSEANPPRSYRDISQDPRYRHYARIPERICRCLDYFGVAFDRGAVKERLLSYYLFIGVADDWIDAGRVEAGRQLLEQLVVEAPSFDAEGSRSDAGLAIEALRRHIGPDSHPALPARLCELYSAVVGERNSETMKEYIEQRSAVGQLTAEVSYLLIRSLLDGGRREDLRRFFRKVGEVGCLLDSVIDLRSDARLGLLSFKPTRGDRLRLAVRTLHEGGRVLLKHPRLLGLFLGAAADVLLDRLRARALPPPATDPLDEVNGGRVCERAA